MAAQRNELEDRAREVARELGCGAEEVETIETLLELGVGSDAMRRALGRGRLEHAIFDEAFDPDRAKRTISPREIEARGGLPVGEVALLMQTAGLPAPAPDEPWFTDDEAQMFVDRIAPLADTEAFQREVPRARTVVLEGSGHMPMLERPRAFNRQLIEFAGSLW